MKNHPYPSTPQAGPSTMPSADREALRSAALEAAATQKAVLMERRERLLREGKARAAHGDVPCSFHVLMFVCSNTHGAAPQSCDILTFISLFSVIFGISVQLD